MINLQDDEYPDFEPLGCEFEGCDEDAEDEYRSKWYCHHCLDKILSEGK